MSSKLRYLYMLLGAVAVLAGFVLILSMPSFTLALQEEPDPTPEARVFLPLTFNGDSSNAVDDRLETGVVGGVPTPSGDPSDLPTPPPYTEEELTELEQAFEDSGTWESAGPTTAGRSLDIAGELISMPDNFYIEHYIMAHLCDDLTPVCLEAPIYILADFDSDSTLQVSAVDGEIAPAIERTPGQHVQDLVRFVWLTEQLEDLNITGP